MPRKNWMYKFQVIWRYRKVSKWVSILEIGIETRYRKVSILKMGIVVRYRYLNLVSKSIDSWKRYRYPTLIKLHRGSKIDLYFRIRQNPGIFPNLQSQNLNAFLNLCHHDRILQYCQFPGCQVEKSWLLKFWSESFL